MEYQPTVTVLLTGGSVPSSRPYGVDGVLSLGAIPDHSPAMANDARKVRRSSADPSNSAPATLLGPLILQLRLRSTDRFTNVFRLVMNCLYASSEE